MMSEKMQDRMPEKNVRKTERMPDQNVRKNMPYILPDEMSETMTE